MYNSSAPLYPPSTVDAYEETLNDMQLAPFTPVTIGTPDSSLELGVSFATFDNGINRAAFNNGLLLMKI
jgi:iron transport multicopper oxidase